MEYQALYAPIQDTHSNRAIFITAQTINEVSKEVDNMNEATIQNLWSDLKTWVIERPLSVRCILEVAADESYPAILFSNPSAGIKPYLIILLQDSLTR